MHKYKRIPHIRPISAIILHYLWKKEFGTFSKFEDFLTMWCDYDVILMRLWWYAQNIRCHANLASYHHNHIIITWYCQFSAIFSQKMFHSTRFDQKKFFDLKVHFRMIYHFQITLRDYLELIMHLITELNVSDFQFKIITS